MPSDARILLVDDHRDTLFALESVLAPLGRPVVLAQSGDEALKTVLRGGVGLVLLDVVMPGTGGLDVVRYMQGVDRAQDVPVVLITGLGPDRELSQRAHELGVADLLAKPVDPWTLRTKARFLLRQYERVRALEEELRELRSGPGGHGRPRPGGPRAPGDGEEPGPPDPGRSHPQQQPPGGPARPRSPQDARRG